MLYVPCWLKERNRITTLYFSKLIRLYSRPSVCISCIAIFSVTCRICFVFYLPLHPAFVQVFFLVSRGRQSKPTVTIDAGTVVYRPDGGESCSTWPKRPAGISITVATATPHARVVIPSIYPRLAPGVRLIRGRRAR